MAVGYGVTTADLSLASGVLKQVYAGKGIPSVIGERSNVYKLFAKKTIAAVGGQVATSNAAAASFGSLKFPVMVTGNQSMGAIALGGAFPQGDTTNVVHGYTTLTFQAFSIRMSGPDIATAVGDMASFIPTAKLRRNNTLQNFTTDLDRQIFTNSLGTVTGVPDLTHLILDSQKYIQRGMKIDTYTSTSASATSLQVSEVDYDTYPGSAYITTSTNTGALPNDVVYRAGAYGVEMVPLSTAIGNSGTFEGINSATAGFYGWRSLVVDADGAEWDIEKHLWTPMFDANLRSGAEIDVVIAAPNLMTKIVNKYTTQFRRNINGSIMAVDKVNLGFQGGGLEFTNPATDKVCRIILSHHCPDNEYYCLSLKEPTTGVDNFFLTDTGAPSWLPNGGGGDIWHVYRDANAAPYDIYEGFGKYYVALGLLNRAPHVKVTDFKITTP
jgi:hypothetical protein